MISYISYVIYHHYHFTIYLCIYIYNSLRFSTDIYIDYNVTPPPQYHNNIYLYI